MNTYLITETEFTDLHYSENWWNSITIQLLSDEEIINCMLFSNITRIRVEFCKTIKNMFSWVDLGLLEFEYEYNDGYDDEYKEFCCRFYCDNREGDHLSYCSKNYEYFCSIYNKACSISVANRSNEQEQIIENVRIDISSIEDFNIIIREVEKMMQKYGF